MESLNAIIKMNTGSQENPPHFYGKDKISPLNGQDIYKSPVDRFLAVMYTLELSFWLRFYNCNLTFGLMISPDRTLQEFRKKLRRTTLAARNNLSEDKWREDSRKARQQLLELPEFKKARNVFIYINYKSELETIPLVEKAIKMGQEICVPLTLPGLGLEAYRISDPENELAPGFCGIPEPLVRRCQKVDPCSIDVVILPGSVFDLQGGRLGYGGGYYDRFLTDSAPQAIKIGLAFELQVVDKVPVLPHDQPLHFLVTEKRAIKTGA